MRRANLEEFKTSEVGGLVRSCFKVIVAVGNDAATEPSLQKSPTESDFEVKPSEAAVEVIFNPTNSHYIFNRFVDQKDIVEFGPLSPDPRVRHAGPSRDTGAYLAPEVRAMAFRLALEAARRNWSRS
jgi:hypothetical protein